jgi:hypothetical protein
MLKDLLNNPYFSIAFSFILGLGLVSIIRPVCKGAECDSVKAPNPADWNGKVYEMASKCYEYTIKTVDCPSSGSIESFKDNYPYRQSVLRS